MTNIRRINLFAGAGAGKSTLAHRLVGDLKSQGLNCELVREAAKPYAYKKLPIKPWQHLELFSKQIKWELEFLDNGVDLVVCECPSMLCCIYGRINKFKDSLQLEEINDDYEIDYSSVNILLERNKDLKYNSEGRFQDYKQALEIDTIIEKYVHSEFLDALLRYKVGDDSSYHKLLNNLGGKLV